MRKSLIFVPLLCSIFGFLAFMRIPGAEHVRMVHILALLSTGACLGVAIARLAALISAKSSSS